MPATTIQELKDLPFPQIRYEIYIKLLEGAPANYNLTTFLLLTERQQYIKILEALVS